MLYGYTIRLGQEYKIIFSKILEKERNEFDRLQTSDVVRKIIDLGIKEYARLNPGVIDSSSDL